METLDIKTIAVIFFINSLVATLFMAALWQQSRKQFPGISLWLTSFSLLTVAFVLVSLRNVIPDVASILIANTGVVAAAFILYLGLERFVACPSSQLHNYLILAIFVYLYTYFTFFHPDVALRIVLLNITLILMFLQSIWLMLHRVGSQLKPISRATGIICLMCVLVWCYRIILVFFVPTPGDYLNMHFLDAIGLLISQIFTVGLVLVLILMVNRRMSLNILNQEETLVRSKVELEISNRDLTERKRIEATLRESEVRYRDLVNFSKNGVAVYDAAADGEDFIIKDFNRAAESIDNVKKEDIMSKSVLQVFPGIKEFGLFEVFQRVWRTGEPERHPITRYHDNRISGWRDNYVYRLSSGEIVAVYEDVTAHKQAEEALRESEDRFRHLSEAAFEAITIHRDGVLLSANDQFFEMFGYKPDELLGKQVIPLTIAPEARESMRGNISTGSRGPYESIGLRKDGATFSIEIRVREIEHLGGKVRIGAIRDISERKRAEQEILLSAEKFSNFFNSTPTIAAISDLQTGRLIDVNEAFIKTTGYTRHECIGSTTNDLNLWVDLASRDKMIATIKKGGNFNDVETLIRMKSGEIRTLLFSGDKLPIGKQDLLLTQAVDITLRINTLEELKNSRDQIRNLAIRMQVAREEERKNIAVEIHDDLGQSLTVLQIDLSWLIKRMPHEQKELLEKIQSMLRMVRVTDERVREIATRLRPPTLDDLGLVTAIQSYLREFEQRTGIKCEFSSEPGEIILDTDVSIALFRVLQGALTNIAKHAGATLVKTSLVEQPGGLYLEISDNGRGITQKEIAGIKSIGIIGMRERIAFFGGSLQIEGKPGKGTTVKVKIPVQGEMFE